MLDVFGHDPGYPGLMAAAGLTALVLGARAVPPVGPDGRSGGNPRMQFPSEFEWLSPDGTGLLTSYMANHYGAGWVLHQLPDLAAAEADAYEQFRQLAPVAATRNVLLPVGADHVSKDRSGNYSAPEPRPACCLPWIEWAEVRPAQSDIDGQISA